MANKRPRIGKRLIGEVLIDAPGFIENRGSKNARKIGEHTTGMLIEIWFDKHYYSRLQLGDENGKRIGIDEDSIKGLVFNVFKDLLYYALKVKNFIFINYDNQNFRSVRIVVRAACSTGLLNIVMQFYYLFSNRYEVTVITAMVTDNFMLSDGQYVIQVEREGVQR